jgi:hypothetical protein
MPVMKYLIAAILATFTLSASAQTKKLLVANGITATIRHTAGSKTVQVLMPGVEAIDLELSQSAANAFLIKTADYNFDGYKDFAFAGKDASVPDAPTVFDIFLYNPQDKAFEAPENPGGACGQFSNIRLNAADKTLRSSCRSGTRTSTDVFRWVTPFSLELTKSIDNSTEAQQEAAEEKMEKKQEKAGQREDEKEEKKEQRQNKREQRKNAREEKDDDE